MSQSQRVPLAIVAGLLAAATTLLLLALLDGTTAPASAAPGQRAAAVPAERPLSNGTFTRYVAITGTDSGDCSTPISACLTIQYAVDRSSAGDEILVATGIYTGVQTRGGVTQVVYIDETVTIHGGYTTTNWTTPDPVANPTTLDAGGQGRVVYISGDVTPTLEALRLTNGYDSLNGGGIYGYGAFPIISGCHIFGNTADNNGGGVYLHYSDDAMLAGNHVYSNVATIGGGVYLFYSDHAGLIGNHVMVNRGGGVFINSSRYATLVNNMVVENWFIDPMGEGPGVFLYSNSDASFLHTTIARNSGGDGSGLDVTTGSTAALTNTVLVSHTTGIYVTADSTATLQATLWGTGSWANDQPWGGSGQILTGTINVWGDPGFVNPDGGDYHIGSGSAAIDAGVEAGIDIDIDEDQRPMGAGPDLGADELGLVLLPLVLRSYP